MKVLILLKKPNEMTFDDRQHLNNNYSMTDVQFAELHGVSIIIAGVKYILDYNQKIYNYEHIPFIELNEKLLKQIKG